MRPTLHCQGLLQSLLLVFIVVFRSNSPISKYCSTHGQCPDGPGTHASVTAARSCCRLRATNGGASEAVALWVWVQACSPVHGMNQWPHQRPSLDAALRQYLAQCLRVGQAIMRGLT